MGQQARCNPDPVCTVLEDRSLALADIETLDPLLFQKCASFHMSSEFYIYLEYYQMDRAASRNNLVRWCLIVTSTFFGIFVAPFCPVVNTGPLIMPSACFLEQKEDGCHISSSPHSYFYPQKRGAVSKPHFISLELEMIPEIEALFPWECFHSQTPPSEGRHHLSFCVMGPLLVNLVRTSSQRKGRRSFTEPIMCILVYLKTTS